LIAAQIFKQFFFSRASIVNLAIDRFWAVVAIGVTDLAHRYRLRFQPVAATD
jgi:hypothetical protein